MQIRRIISSTAPGLDADDRIHLELYLQVMVNIMMTIKSLALYAHSFSKHITEAIEQ